MTIFETQRLRIRKFTDTDAENFFSLQGNPDVMRYIRPVRSRLESDDYLENKILTADPSLRIGYWAVEDRATNIFMGSFVIIPIPGEEHKIQMGYSFLPIYWHKGYATEAAIAGVHYFRTNTDLELLYGVTETGNLASQRVLLKAGFSFLETKVENNVDLLVYVIENSRVTG